MEFTNNAIEMMKNCYTNQLIFIKNVINGEFIDEGDFGDPKKCDILVILGDMTVVPIDTTKRGYYPMRKLRVRYDNSGNSMGYRERYQISDVFINLTGDIANDIEEYNKNHISIYGDSEKIIAYIEA